MELFNRRGLNPNQLNSIYNGVKKSLSKPLLNKVELLRASVVLKKKFGIYVMETFWARPDRAPLGVFPLSLTLPFPNSVDNFEPRHWEDAGQQIGLDMSHWIENDEEFATLERKITNQQFHAYETDYYWDVANDIINDLEHTYGPHINGSLHWRVKAYLNKLIAELLRNHRNELLKDLSKEENLDLLKEIIQNSKLVLKSNSSRTSPPKTKVTADGNN